MSIEQISSGDTVNYVHHDQQGSTRHLTGSTGTIAGSITFDACGNKTGSTGTSTTPLGYDGQYTSSDTGLIYLRNRVYDPTTAQFLTVDPAVLVTRASYNYAQGNPLNREDPTGLSAEGLGENGVPCIWPFCAPPPGAEEGARAVGNGIAEGAKDVYEGAKHGVESVWNAISHKGDPSNENTQSEGACGNTPPGYDPETWAKGPASRPSDPGENFYDPEGGEWRWHAPDKADHSPACLSRLRRSLRSESPTAGTSARAPARAAFRRRSAP
jgi:RHS repeat-associated protein